MALDLKKIYVLEYGDGITTPLKRRLVLYLNGENPEDYTWREYSWDRLDGANAYTQPFNYSGALTYAVPTKDEILSIEVGESMKERVFEFLNTNGRVKIKVRTVRDTGYDVEGPVAGVQMAVWDADSEEWAGWGSYINGGVLYPTATDLAINATAVRNSIAGWKGQGGYISKEGVYYLRFTIGWILNNDNPNRRLVGSILLPEYNPGYEWDSFNNIDMIPAVFEYYGYWSGDDAYQIIQDIIDGGSDAFPDQPDDTGGGGSGDDSSDDITPPDEPPEGYDSNRGMSKVYKVTQNSLTNLTSFLFDNNIFNTFIKKIYSEPWQCIVSLIKLPFNVSISGSTDIVLGTFNTEIAAESVSHLWQDVDCGSVQVDEYVGNYIDYAPMTKISLYLPYVGLMSLDTNIVMGASVSVKYRIDVMTGSFVVYVTTSRAGRVQTIYQYTGNMAIQLPLSNVSNAILGSFIMGAFKGATAVAGQGIVPMALAGAGGAIAGGAGTAYLNHDKVTSVTSFDANAGWLGIQIPFLMIDRAVPSYSPNYNIYNGFTCYRTHQLSNLSGFTKMQTVRVEINGATREECEEIEQFLKTGVIL